MIHDLSTQKGRNAYVEAMEGKNVNYITQPNPITKEVNVITTNIYLDRLKQQYSIYKQGLDLPVAQDEFWKRKDYYDAMRLFCLDTQLVSFNDIEVMEHSFV